jgi:hypothetical protein
MRIFTKQRGILRSNLDRWSTNEWLMNALDWQQPPWTRCGSLLARMGTTLWFIVLDRDRCKMGSGQWRSSPARSHDGWTVMSSDGCVMPPEGFVDGKRSLWCFSGLQTWSRRFAARSSLSSWALIALNCGRLTSTTISLSSRVWSFCGQKFETKRPVFIKIFVPRHRRGRLLLILSITGLKLEILEEIWKVAKIPQEHHMNSVLGRSSRSNWASGSLTTTVGSRDGSRGQVGHAGGFGP